MISHKSLLIHLCIFFQNEAQHKFCEVKDPPSITFFASTQKCSKNFFKEIQILQFFKHNFIPFCSHSIQEPKEIDESSKHTRISFSALQN